MFYKIILIGIVSILLISIPSCANEQVIRVGIAPIANANNILYVATEDKIPVAIEGQNGILYMSVPGYYLIPPDDLRIILEELKEKR